MQEAALVGELVGLRITPRGLQSRFGWACPSCPPSVPKVPAERRSSSLCWTCCMSGAPRRSPLPAPSPRRHPAGKHTPQSPSRRWHACGEWQAPRPPLHSLLPDAELVVGAQTPPGSMMSWRPPRTVPEAGAVARRRRLSGVAVGVRLGPTPEGFRSMEEVESGGGRPPPRSREACSHSRTLKVDRNKSIRLSKHTSSIHLLTFVIFKVISLTKNDYSRYFIRLPQRWINTRKDRRCWDFCLSHCLCMCRVKSRVLILDLKSNMFTTGLGLSQAHIWPNSQFVTLVDLISCFCQWPE